MFLRLVICTSQNTELEFQKVFPCRKCRFLGMEEWLHISFSVIVKYPSLRQNLFTTAFGERCEFCHTCSEQVRFCNNVTPQSHLLLLVCSCLHTSVFSLNALPFENDRSKLSLLVFKVRHC